MSEYTDYSVNISPSFKLLNACEQCLEGQAPFGDDSSCSVILLDLQRATLISATDSVYIHI